MTRREQRKAAQEAIQNTSQRHQKKRTKLWDETNGQCAYCGRDIQIKDRTMDHLWPKSKGGTLELENLIPACQPCNVKRSLKYPASAHASGQWVDYIKRKERAQGYFHPPENKLI